MTTGEVKVFRNAKAPLYNDEGKVIGIIGSAIDVTSEKEAEQLKILNAKQKIMLEQQEKFTKLASQVAHDIRSPLAGLLVVLKDCSQLPESSRIALREAAINIGDIANNLLHQYQKKDGADIIEYETHQPLLLSTVLWETLSAKKYQYEKLPLTFDFDFEAHTHFAFIKTQASAFKRLLSNLINNAVDAMDGHTGRIVLGLKADNEWVKISILDTGKGMPGELIAKIMQKTAVTEGKKSGHGIGLTQVWETLDKNQGELHIASEMGKGTVITLTFPRITAPYWIAEEICLNSNDTVVILDDDASIHGAWSSRFEALSNETVQIQRKHFQEGKEALAFIKALTPSEKEHVFLLSGYELLKQDLRGLDVITHSQIPRSMLVTSHYADLSIQTEAAKTGTKILPKQLASEVQISIAKANEKKLDAAGLEKVYAVIVDDNKAFVNMLLLHFFEDELTATYHNPTHFLNDVGKYAKDTKIYLDNHFDGFPETGLEIAEKLHAQGFTQLFILSGEPFNKSDIPSYVTLIEKTEVMHLDNL